METESASLGVGKVSLDHVSRIMKRSFHNSRKIKSVFHVSKK